MLLARHTPRVRAFVATLVGHDSDTIDDVVQSTLLIAWKKLNTFRYAEKNPEEELIRWVCTIARFEVLEYLRDKKRRRTIAFDEQLIGQLADLQEEQSGPLDDRRRALRGCLQQLQPKQQEAIRLRYAVGLSMTEIAAREQRSIKAATVAMCRLRKLLEKCVRQSLGLKGLA
ncbi:sigma-70 family RNA polymerase sigma factor [Botrimarina hoheduenensis]|nr:sigma-70 family RNA polymerase sigma factor [Botrimarina hoheduenensis]